MACKSDGGGEKHGAGGLVLRSRAAGAILGGNEEQDMATSIITANFRSSDAPGDVSLREKSLNTRSFLTWQTGAAWRDMGKPGKTTGFADSAGTRSGPN